MKYTALGEGLVTNIALSFASTIFATRLSPQAVYFIQTGGGSALSDTYYLLYNKLLLQGLSNCHIRMLNTMHAIS